MTWPVFPNRIGWVDGREEFFGIDDPVETPTDLVAETIHDGETDGKDIGAGQVVEIDIFDKQLADAPVVAPFPPAEGTVGKMRLVRQRGDQMPLHIRHKQHPCGASDHLRNELVRLTSGAGIVFPQEAGQTDCP